MNTSSDSQWSDIQTPNEWMKIVGLHRGQEIKKKKTVDKEANWSFEIQKQITLPVNAKIEIGRIASSYLNNCTVQEHYMSRAQLNTSSTEIAAPQIKVKTLKSRKIKY